MGLWGGVQASIRTFAPAHVTVEVDHDGGIKTGNNTLNDCSRFRLTLNRKIPIQIESAGVEDVETLAASVGILNRC